MVTESPSVANPTPPIRQEDALDRLALLEAPRDLIFYKSGIVDAGLGYYQLTRLQDKDNRRLLMFALNLEDLQLKEYPGVGSVYAHPGTLYCVNAYDKSASPNDIYTDLVKHQAGLTRAMREEYTLVRTGNGVYQSPALSYAIKQNGATASVDVFVNSLRDGGFAPASIGTDGSLYDKLQVSRIPMNIKTDAKDAVFHILSHYTEKLDRLARGEEGIHGEDTKLSRWSSMGLRIKMYGVRLADNLTRTFKQKVDELKEKPSASVELIERVAALMKIPSLIVDIGKGGIELVQTLWEAFSFSRHEPEQKTPELLKPYLMPGKLRSRLNPYLPLINSTTTEMAVPLTLDEANIAPPKATVYPGSPFDIVKDRAPDISALRAPLGTILQLYPHTTLLMQANGVWMAMRHDLPKTDKVDKIYVGYNRQMDTNSKPYPSPILNAWLSNEHVICYTREGHEYKAAIMDWKQAASDLHEITASGSDGDLLATNTPTRDHGRLVIPARAAPNMRYLDFSTIMRERGMLPESPPADSEAGEAPQKNCRTPRPHRHLRPARQDTPQRLRFARATVRGDFTK